MNGLLHLQILCAERSYYNWNFPFNTKFHIFLQSHLMCEQFDCCCCAAGLSGFLSLYSLSSVILSNQRSTHGRAFTWKEPITPALHWAITKSGFDIINKGAATTGNLRFLFLIGGVHELIFYYLFVIRFLRLASWVIKPFFIKIFAMIKLSTYLKKHRY